jgi:hypothetical protein
MPLLSRTQVWDSIAQHFEEVAAARRDAAKGADSNEERQRQNRGSAHLLAAAAHVRRQDDTHHDLSELHAWDNAQDQYGEYRWSPNEAQAEAIRRYADEASAGPDALLADLNRLR